MTHAEELIRGRDLTAALQSRLAESDEVIENLQRKLESQPVIEQAKGILMARAHCSPDEAFEMLRRASMRMNRKLRDLAAEIVAATVHSSRRVEHRQALPPDAPSLRPTAVAPPSGVANVGLHRRVRG